MLHIIQGRSGSGKTYFIRNKIKEILNEGEFRPLLLVPDQFSFENERAMLSFLGAKNMTGVDVLSFPRLANSNLDSKVLQGKLFADDGVRMAYMSEALTQLSDDLKIFSKVRHNVSGLKSFIDFNKELKTCDVTGEDIEALVEKMPENLLKEKLSEINLINEAYNALLTRSYFDDTECLRYFNEFAADTHFFKNKIVFLDSFRAFSEQEFKCIRLALVQAQDVYISICTDETVRGESPFVYMNELKKKIISLANKCNVRIAPVVTLKYNDSFNKSIRHIEENIYCEEAEIFNENSDGVTILKCNDITDECNVVALEIKKLIRSGKYRCKDIAVVERSSDKYKRIMCDVLTRYGVPVFDDSRRPLSFETLFIHVTSAVECITDGFKTESVMRYLKTGLSELSFEDVSTLEKYVLVWGINGSAWTTDFTMHPDGFGSEIDESVEKRINYLNELRKKAILPLLKMKKNCEGASGLDVTKAVYDFLVDTKTSDKLYKLSVGLNAQGFPEEALRKETSWDVLIELLDTIAEITKDKYYTIKRWFELFSILVFSKDIGEIPQGLDEVKVGSADRIRTENLKVIFLVGVNKNEFPLIASVGGLLSDSDRRVLTNEMELKIRPAFEESVYEERFIAYCMLTAAKEKLYLSYREVSDDDSTGGASEIIDEIKEFLPQVNIVSSDDIDNTERIESEFSAFFTLAKIYNENSELRNTLLEYFKNKPEYYGRLNSIEFLKNGKKGEFAAPDISKELFGKNLGVSASRLDSFYQCPFSFFCRYGLRLNPLKAAELHPTDSGLIVHGVLEAVLKKYKNTEFLKLSDEELRNIISEYLKTYLEEKMGGFQDKSKRFMFLYNRMIDVLMVVFERLKNEFASIDFTPVDFELSIGGEEIPAYTLPLEDGGEISVYGSVDRVDLMEKDGIRYIRVVDYKTGKKEFKLSNLLSGINLQMVLYLMAITANGKDYYGETIPAGVLYLPSRIGINDYLSSRNPSAENIEAQKRHSGKLSGMILNSPVVLNGMGINDFPDYLPVKYKKDNTVSGNYYSQKNFRILSEKIDEKITGMGNSVHKGEFLVLPSSYQGEAKQCSYCNFRSVCGFESGDDTNEICNDKHAEVLEMLGGDNNE